MDTSFYYCRPNPTYHKQTDEADLGDTTEDDGPAERSPLAKDIEATEL